MDSERPHQSITLPRNFMFHYRDGQAPQTPEPEPQPEQLQPPAPPRQTLKVRRRRTTFVLNQDFDDFPDVVPIPTIEAPELHSDSSMGLPTLPHILDSGYDTGYLSPAVQFSQTISPPKTPVSQMRGHGGFEGPQHWSDVDQASQSESSSRPTSSSGFSDSSVSSRGHDGSVLVRSTGTQVPPLEFANCRTQATPATPASETEAAGHLHRRDGPPPMDDLYEVLARSYCNAVQGAAEHCPAKWCLSSRREDGEEDLESKNSYQ
jgi:hypothetical protein